MPTRNISLTPEQDAFVDEIVESGEYQNASEAGRDALRALQQRRQEDMLKLELLRSHVRFTRQLFQTIVAETTAVNGAVLDIRAGGG